MIPGPSQEATGDLKRGAKTWSQNRCQKRCPNDCPEDCFQHGAPIGLASLCVCFLHTGASQADWGTVFRAPPLRTVSGTASGTASGTHSGTTFGCHFGDHFGSPLEVSRWAHGWSVEGDGFKKNYEKNWGTNLQRSILSDIHHQAQTASAIDAPARTAFLGARWRSTLGQSIHHPTHASEPFAASFFSFLAFFFFLFRGWRW